MVRYIYSFFIGMLFLNLQAYGMVDDMGGAEPENHAAARARAIQAIQKADHWKHFGKDFGEMLDKNATYFLKGLELTPAVWHTFTGLYSSYKPSQTESSEFREIDREIKKLVVKDVLDNVCDFAFDAFERVVFGGGNRPMPRPVGGSFADLKAREPEFVEAYRRFRVNKKKYKTQQIERSAREYSELIAERGKKLLAEQEKEREKERLAAELRADNSSNKGILVRFLGFVTPSLPDSSGLTDWRR